MLHIAVGMGVHLLSFCTCSACSKKSSQMVPFAKVALRCQFFIFYLFYFLGVCEERLAFNFSPDCFIELIQRALETFF